MTRYFFDIMNGNGDIRDETGLEFSTDAQVESEIAKILSDIVREEVISERNGRVIVIVRDEGGRERFRGSLVFSVEAAG